MTDENGCLSSSVIPCRNNGNISSEQKELALETANYWDLDFSERIWLFFLFSVVERRRGVGNTHHLSGMVHGVNTII